MQDQGQTARRYNIATLSILTIVVVSAAGLGGQTQEFRARNNERALVVSVLDQDGKPVQGLSPIDFVVEEDGAEREVLSAARATAAMQLAILVDTSGAAAFATRDVRDGLTTFVSDLHEGNEISLVTFGGAPRILVESTRRLERLQDGIGRVFAFPNTAAYLLDSLLETTRGFERRASPRPVIVVVTSEGIDYSNNHSRRVLEALQSNQVPTHVIVIRDGAGSIRRGDWISNGELEYNLHQRDLVLAQGPKMTGGQRRDLLISSALGNTLSLLSKILSNQYDVVYSRPTRLIPPDQISVRTRRSDLTVRATPVRQPGD